MKFFKDKEEAVAAGEEEENLVSLHWRTPKEKRALELAAQFGNRRARRDRRFRAHLITVEETGATVPDLHPAERNKRNAKRRVAKKQRKRNA